MPLLIASFMYRAVVQKYSVKKVFLEISQNSQENACARVSFLIKLLNVLERKTKDFFFFSYTYAYSYTSLKLIVSLGRYLSVKY